MVPYVLTLKDTYIQVYQRSIITNLSQFDEHIKEYKASLQLSTDDECEVSPELTVIVDIYIVIAEQRAQIIGILN